MRPDGFMGRSIFSFAYAKNKTVPACELHVAIDHLHYVVIRAKPNGSCSRPAETGTSFPGGKARESQQVALKRYQVEH